VDSEVKPGIKVMGAENIKITGVRLEIKGLLNLKSEKVSNEEINVKAWCNNDFNETVISLEFKKPLQFTRKNVNKAIEKVLTISERLYT